VVIRTLSNNRLGNKLFQNVSGESAAAWPLRLRTRFHEAGKSGRFIWR
jgi:hypothetical protein